MRFSFKLFVLGHACACLLVTVRLLLLGQLCQQAGTNTLTKWAWETRVRDRCSYYTPRNVKKIINHSRMKVHQSLLVCFRNDEMKMNALRKKDSIAILLKHQVDMRVFMTSKLLIANVRLVALEGLTCSHFQWMLNTHVTVSCTSASHLSNDSNGPCTTFVFKESFHELSFRLFSSFVAVWKWFFNAIWSYCITLSPFHEICGIRRRYYHLSKKMYCLLDIFFSISCACSTCFDHIWLHDFFSDVTENWTIPFFFTPCICRRRIFRCQLHNTKKNRTWYSRKDLAELEVLWVIECYPVSPTLVINSFDFSLHWLNFSVFFKSFINESPFGCVFTISSRLESSFSITWSLLSRLLNGTFEFRNQCHPYEPSRTSLCDFLRGACDEFPRASRLVCLEEYGRSRVEIIKILMPMMQIWREYDSR